MTGCPDVQGGRGNGFDGGTAFAAFIGERPASSAFPAEIGLLIGVGLLPLWLYAPGIRRHRPLPPLVHGGVVVVLAPAAKGHIGSKPRLPIPAFPPPLPLSVNLARAGPARTPLAPGLVGLASAFHGALRLHGSAPPQGSGSGQPRAAERQATARETLGNTPANHR